MSEDKQAKPFTAKEIKAIEPLAETYQFSKSNRYIVMIPKSELIGGEDLVRQKAQMIYKMFTQAEIPAMILVGSDRDLTIFEIK